MLNDVDYYIVRLNKSTMICYFKDKNYCEQVFKLMNTTFVLDNPNVADKYNEAISLLKEFPDNTIVPFYFVDYDNENSAPSKILATVSPDKSMIVQICPDVKNAFVLLCDKN
jgi:hypothetical protein